MAYKKLLRSDLFCPNVIGSKSGVFGSSYSATGMLGGTLNNTFTWQAGSTGPYDNYTLTANAHNSNAIYTAHNTKQ